MTDEEVPKKTIEKKVLTPQEFANQLGMSVNTVYAYIQCGLLTNQEYAVIQHEKRRRYVFFATALDTFMARQSGMQSSDRPQRTYNKRAIKGKHKKVS